MTPASQAAVAAELTAHTEESAAHSAVHIHAPSAGATATLIHDLRVDRDEIEVSCSKAAAVMLLGRGSRAEQVMAPAQERVRLPTGKFRGGYVRAVVIDEQRRRAWSNPVWLPA